MLLLFVELYLVFVIVLYDSFNKLLIIEYLQVRAGTVAMSDTRWGLIPVSVEFCGTSLICVWANSAELLIVAR